MKNIVLIGMPAVGKSTIGVLLAKTLLLNFVDTDLAIQKEYSMSLSAIIERDGVEKFIEIENDVISKCNFKNSVVATGGSAVYGKEAMENLKENAVVVYLKLPIEEIEKRISNIKTRGVAIKAGSTLKDLFNEREALYKKYADIEISCEGKTAEECVEVIVEKLKEC